MATHNLAPFGILLNIFVCILYVANTFKNSSVSALLSSFAIVPLHFDLNRIPPYHRGFRKEQNLIRYFQYKKFSRLHQAPTVCEGKSLLNGITDKNSFRRCAATHFQLLEWKITEKFSSSVWNNVVSESPAIMKNSTLTLNDGSKWISRFQEIMSLTRRFQSIKITLHSSKQPYYLEKWTENAINLLLERRHIGIVSYYEKFHTYPERWKQMDITI
ncbi:hypothetical protein Bhyg_03767 [Pseudolycoriella hygida]|uniref:Uncharacterized protein n=1 Tax=Pseudolycoriella hygida TaxID=35572 RepID=A0A9Q0NEM9_9DIPT|nr:hypothetical protein Bhyg_03767 [Pseudolycoriella hygida]